MKILVVTNLYPPQHIGGYELGCRDVVEKLSQRGHDVRVLTSTFCNRKNESIHEPHVERTLQFNISPSDPAHDKRIECKKFTEAVNRFAPDIVYFWNQAGLCYWLPFAAHWHGCRMAFYLSDTNFISWRIGAWLAGAAQKNALIRVIFGNTFLVRGWPIIENRACHFTSEFIRQTAVKNGIAYSPRESIVAHWGIEQKEVPTTSRQRKTVRKLLYAGQLIEQKGVHTAIAAIGLLAKEKSFAELTLSIVGAGHFPDYENRLRAQVKQLGLEQRVKFFGRLPRELLPQIYAEHDALIFPSEWDEPFAITPLEAIHAGLAVIGTTTGGSGELFRNHETAMTFRAGDAADCARAIRELCTDHDLFEKISSNAQSEVRAKHTLDAMVEKIEASLVALAAK